MHEFRQRVRQAARADIMYGEDRIGLTQTTAGIDDLLCTPLHFRIAALH